MTHAKFAIGAALAGAFILGALAVGFSSAQPEPAISKPPQHLPDTSFSNSQEEEIGEIVRAYLMENPEVIIEAVNEYSSRQRYAAEERMRQVAAENLSFLLDPETGYVGGKNPAKAKVAVIEMFDYHCSFCKHASSLVKDITKKDAGVKVAFRELPILREESGYAAEMSLAARDQGKFLDLHFAMMGASGVLTKERVQDFARKQGLDVKKMEAAIQNGKISSAIESNQAIAAEMGAEGTPVFIIASLNGDYVEVINGYRPEEIRTMIKEAKKAAG